MKGKRGGGTAKDLVHEKQKSTKSALLFKTSSS
jgi:hypothetical protein